MRLFKCIVDDGDDGDEDIINTYTAGKTKKKDMLNSYGGNGEFLKVEDVTSNHLNQDSIKALEIDLIEKGWEEAEPLY